MLFTYIITIDLFQAESTLTRKTGQLLADGSYLLQSGTMDYMHRGLTANTLNSLER